MATASPLPQPRSRVEELEEEVRLLRLQVEKLKVELWGRKSEKSPVVPDGQQSLFGELPRNDPPALVPSPAPTEGTASPKTRKGPQPLSPSLPREKITVADPAPERLLCTDTGRPLRAGFVDTLEVLARRPAVWYVKRYERTVWVGAAKNAPVYSEWPADVLPRARAHASVVAHVAAQHFCEHQPFNRIEKHLERVGVELPRSTQVSLMEQLDIRVSPLVERLKAHVLASGYVHLDATPIDLCDPARPGRVREATLWAYRSKDGAVWFDYALSKSPERPRTILAQYTGVLQTDAAAGLETIGQPEQVTHLACFAHLRRYFYRAVQLKETAAQPYLDQINTLFRHEREAAEQNLDEEERQRRRTTSSLPLFLGLIEQAQADQLRTLPKSELGKALQYLLAQKDSLVRCLTTPGARLDNNPAENAIRPLKLGAKNWLQIGHPSAGPRLARLFALVENCRQLGIDPETYLIDLIARILDHPNKTLDELLPHRWLAARDSSTANA